MKIAIICPVPHLRDFAIQSDFHLILPHLYNKFPEYLEFYKERIKKGDFVIQDNSFFELEKSFDWRHSIEYAEDLKVSELVIPEVLNDREGCKKIRESFLNNVYYKYKSKIPLLAVAQGKNAEDLIDDILDLQNVNEISTIGIPFDLRWEDLFYTQGVPSLTLRRVLNRWYVINKLVEISEIVGLKLKPVHLMGLSDGIELSHYRDKEKFYFIRSNDSSSAYVHGSNLIWYNNKGLPSEKISEKLDFGSDLNSVSIKLFGNTSPVSLMNQCIDYNIEILKQFAGYLNEQDKTSSDIRFDTTSIRGWDSSKETPNRVTEN